MSENKIKKDLCNERAGIGILAFIPNPIISVNEAWFLSNTEKVHMLFCKINEIINKVNSYEELFTQIQGVLNDFDDTVKTEVEKYIKQMYDNGELKTILENISVNYFNSLTAPRVSEVNATRLFRIELNAMPFSTQDFSSAEMEKYSFIQGGTMFERQGIKYYIACAVCSNLSPYSYNDNVDVRRYMYLGGKWQFETHSVQSLGHADCITYDSVNDCFYVSYSQEYNGGNTAQAVKKVDKLDWNLAVVARYNFTNFGGQDFNRISSCYAYNGELYLGVGSSRWTNIHIEKVTSFEDLTTEVVVNYRDYNSFGNTAENIVMSGFAMNDNYIFVATNQPNGVIRYNRTTNEIDNFYHIGNYINEHMFTTGEVENISLIGDEIFIGSSITANPTSYNYFCYMNLSKFNYVNNMNFSQGLYTPFQQLSGSANTEIFVGVEGQNENIGVTEICNPNGFLNNNWNGKSGKGDGNMPFPRLTEALMYCQSQVQYQNITIVPITRNDVYPVVFSGGKCSISIDGSAYYNMNKNDSTFRNRYYHAGGMVVIGGVVKLRKVCIENRTNDNVGVGEFSNYTLSVNGGVLNMLDCIISNYGIHKDGYRKLNANACIINMDNMYNDDGSVISFDKTNTNIYHCVLITHGHWGGSNTYAVLN